ncbi:MAG: ATP-dependent helicase [Candidatus Omnitrophota bacterium]|nr:MAG: ATP-dependent helicase [Candidatus Omnitrophota bacterium]
MVNFTKYYNKLNARQRQAVDTTDGPVLVLAGPGTGKTELLSVRAANIIHKKMALPENLLILTYTNAAAKTMKERLGKILGPKGYEMEICTFHSFANSTILESEEAANYIQEKIEISSIEKMRAFEYILDHTEGIDPVRPFRAPYTYRSEIEKRIGELKKEGVSPEKFQKYADNVKKDDIYIQDKHIPRLKAFAKVYKLYEAYKRGENEELFDERGRYDFDDMIMLALETVKKEEELKRQIQRQYTYIMVDEYQDTNGAQLELLFSILPDKSPNICCVGDDDQSIYRFQGASTGNFRVFKKRFPDASLVSLQDSYRSTEEIIDITAKIIDQLPSDERVETKRLNVTCKYKNKIIDFNQFSTETEELLYIAKKIEGLKKTVSYSDIAVLLRKREDILKVIDVFQKKGIPYATDGKENIANETRVRQMLDVLYLVNCRNTTDAREKDAYFYRVISSDYFNIPTQDILRLINKVNQQKMKLKKQATLLQEFLDIFPIKAKDTAPPSSETKKLPVLKQISFKAPEKLHFASWVINRLFSKSQDTPAHAIIMHFIKDANLYGYILEAFKDKQVLKTRDLRALSSFVNMVKASDLTRPGIKLPEFLEEIEIRKEHGISLQGDLVTQTQEGVRVFTAHGSKGLEFSVVFLPFCLQDKNWPVRPRPELIPLPPEIFKTKERVKDKSKIKQLILYDEIRLFYVASTRAKSHLIYTASPAENRVTSFYIEKLGLTLKDYEAKEEDVIKAALSLSDKKDPFIGTENILKDLTSALTLNPTSINTYIRCKRKFLYNNILQIPSTKKRPLIFGTCVHKALEDTYRRFKETKQFPNFAFFKESFKRELNFQGVEKSIYAQCEREVENLRGWFANEAKSPIEPVGLEQRLSINLNGIVFTGYYDKTELIDKKTKAVRVIDYKTGKPDKHIRAIKECTDMASDEYDDYLRQLVAYKMLFDGSVKINKGYKVDAGKLIFIDSAAKKDFKNKEIRISQDMVNQLDEVIRDCWRRINNLEFEKLPEPDKDKCGTQKNQRCEFYDICWG